MNTKTYNFTKYIATIGSILLFTAPLLGFLQAWKDIFNGNYTTLAIVSIVLEVIGAIVIGIYIILRNKLKNKSGYKYTKRDTRLLYLSFMSYGLAIIFSLIYVIVSSSVQDNDKTVMILFAPLYVLEIIWLIGAAILESMSRIEEQIYLYNVEEQLKDKKTIKVSKTGTKRTNEAQALIKNKNNAKSTEIVDDEKEIEDFFNKEKSKNE